ncbi:hypothetical protein AAC387_Pa12g2128 [Persea americana]
MRGEEQGRNRGGRREERKRQSENQGREGVVCRWAQGGTEEEAGERERKRGGRREERERKREPRERGSGFRWALQQAQARGDRGGRRREEGR